MTKLSDISRSRLGGLWAGFSRERFLLWVGAGLPWAVAGVVLAILCHRFDLLRVCAEWATTRVQPPDLRLWLVVPAAGSAAVVVAAMSRWPTRLLASLGALLVAALAPALPLNLFYLFLFLPPALVVWAWWRRNQTGDPMPAALAPTAAIVLVLALAARMRGLVLVSLLPTTLDPDSIGYMQLARDNSGYDTHFREPGFIWLLQILKNVTGGDYSDAAGRLYGFLLALVAIAVTFAVVQRFFGLVAAVVAGVFYAVSKELAFDAVRLLREDTIITAFLLYAALFLKTWGAPPLARTYLLMGLVAAPSMLLRMNSNYFIMLTMAVHFGWAAWRHRPPLRGYAWLPIGMLVAVAPLLPYLVYCSKKYNDPWYKSGLEARYFANIELAGKHPELPTRAEFEQENYAGGPMKMSTYLFRYHTLGELLDGAWAGTKRLLVDDLAEYAYMVVKVPRPEKLPLMWLHLLGLAAYFLSPPRRLLLALFALFHLPSLYLVQFDWFDPRLLTLAYVGFYIGCGLAVATAVQWARRLMLATAPATQRASPSPARKPHPRRK